MTELPFNWDFLQDNLPPEKLAELRRRFMEEWRSGKYTREEMVERYRMSERTFWYTIKRYADAKELDDYRDKSRAPHQPHRKFTDEDYNDVVKTFDETREELEKRFAHFEEDMRAAGKNLSSSKLNAQKQKIWDVRAGVRKLKAIMEKIWASAKKAKTIGKSCVHAILKRFGRYLEEEGENVTPEEFLRPPEPGERFCIDTGTCFIGDKTKMYFQPIFDEFNRELVVLVAGIRCDHTLSLKALEELCRIYPNVKFQIRSDGGSEFDNNDVKDFFVENDISWIKVSKPWDNPFAERGIRTIKHEYLNQVWIGDFHEFVKLSKIIKLHYNECRPHQSFDNKTLVEIRIAKTGDKKETSEKIEKWDTFFRTILGRPGTAIS
jgi:Integrase core domain.